MNKAVERVLLTYVIINDKWLALVGKTVGDGLWGGFVFVLIK